MILFIILVLVDLYILYITKEPIQLRIVKEKYKILRDHIKRENIEVFKNLKNCIVINGYYSTGGHVGYNTNKGEEIGLCVTGESNEIFHVLLHELAHSTVSEYDHSEQFWKNYTKLRDLAIDLGIYSAIPEKVPFCGKHIQDK